MTPCTCRFPDELPRPLLTPREQNILQAYANGYTTPAIANRLGLAHDTVKSYTRQIREKLGAHSTLHAVAICIRLGLVE